MSEIRVTSVVGENGGDRVGLTTGLTVGPLTGTTGIGATISHQGHAQFAGVCTATNVSAASSVTATTFYGSGANLTGLTSGITMVDQWRITNDNIKTSDQVIDSNWERSDAFFAQIGTGMSQSSGVFTFPQTGIYLVLAQLQMNGSASYAGVSVEVSTDSGGSYGGFTYGYQNMSTVGGYHHLGLHGICDIANVSTHRLRMLAVNNASTQYSGNTNNYRCGMTFIRLGDT